MNRAYMAVGIWYIVSYNVLPDSKNLISNIGKLMQFEKD